jgi:predicted DNA-binding transcriptional regulator YafY
MEGAWYLVGYSHERGGRRTFRLDRVEDLLVTTRNFDRPARSQLRDRGDEERTLAVVVRLDPEVARWARETRPYYWTEAAEGPDGLRVTLRVRHLDEIMPWVLSWGRHAQVLEPDALRRQVAEEAGRMLERNS